MRIILNSLLLILVCPSIVEGQTVIKTTGKGKSIIDVSVYNGLTFNNMNVHNDNVYPSTLSVPSSTYLSQKIAVDFQRITKNNFIYGFGIELGGMKQDFNYEYTSFDFLDPNAESLKSMSKRTEYRNHSLYAGLRLFLGYSFPVHPFKLKSTMLEGKIQVGKQVVFNGAYFNNDINVAYESNGTTYLVPRAMYLSGYWGNGGGSLSGPVFTEANVGIRKEISQSVFNSIYLGFYGSLNSQDNNVKVTNSHYDNSDTPYFDHDKFNNKDFTLGLKLGFGLKT